MVAARSRQADELSWSLAPAWARAGSVAALLAGMILGATFGIRPAAVGPAGAGLVEVGEEEAYALVEPLSLAESFWLTLEADNGLAATADDGEERVQ